MQPMTHSTRNRDNGVCVNYYWHQHLPPCYACLIYIYGESLHVCVCHSAVVVVLIFPLPSDNVQHDLQHWSLIGRRKPRNQKKTHAYILNSPKSWRWSSLSYGAFFPRFEVPKRLQQLFTVVPSKCWSYTLIPATFSRCTFFPDLEVPKELFPHIRSNERNRGSSVSMCFPFSNPRRG